MLEWPILGFYPKLCVDLVDLSNREQKRQKAKTDIFTGTPFSVSPVQSRVKIVEENNKFHNMIRNFINESMIAYKKTKDVELVDKRID